MATDPTKVSEMTEATSFAGTDELLMVIGGNSRRISGANFSASITSVMGGLLEDLDTLGAASADGEFMVATAAGVLAWESGATARASLGLGSMATQAASSVAVTGGTIDGTVIGASTPAAITGTDITATGRVVLPASTDAATGGIWQDGYQLLHTYADATADGENLFIGKNVGNFTMSPGGGASNLSSYNVLVCSGESGQAMTTAQNNTALGWKALYSVTSGDRMVALGYEALWSATTASFAVAIGDAALQQLTDGDGNIGIGYVAGKNITTGQHNVIIGPYAGYGTDGTNAPATDNYGILIGYFANRSVVSSTQLESYIGIGANVNIDKSGQAKIGNPGAITETWLTGDVFVGRDAASTQYAIWTYDIATDDSNYTRGGFSWLNGDLTVGTESAGTGTNANVLFQRDGATLFSFSSSKPTVHTDLFWASDGAGDVGQSGSNRPRDLFTTRNATIGGIVSAASIQSTPIGSVTPSSGAFTTLSATSTLSLAAATTAIASLNIPSGTAPTSPTNGDIWSDGSDILVRLGGTTYTLQKA